MAVFEDTYIGQNRMFRRIGTSRCYPYNERTCEAVCELEWAYAALTKPNVVFPNGKESHECANERIDRNEDALIDYLQFVV